MRLSRPLTWPRVPNGVLRWGALVLAALLIVPLPLLLWLYGRHLVWVFGLAAVLTFFVPVAESYNELSTDPAQLAKLKSLCGDPTYDRVIVQCPAGIGRTLAGEPNGPSPETSLTLEGLTQALQLYCAAIPEPCNPRNVDEVPGWYGRPRGWSGGY